MATGDPPWRILKLGSPYALMMAVLEADGGPPLAAYDLSPDLRDFCETCFRRDVDDRPTARAMARHRFIRGGARAPAAAPAEDAVNVNAVGPEPGRSSKQASGGGSVLQNLKARMSRTLGLSGDGAPS